MDRSRVSSDGLGESLLAGEEKPQEVDWGRALALGEKVVEEVGNHVNSWRLP